jgi:hypothetical protein
MANNSTRGTLTRGTLEGWERLERAPVAQTHIVSYSLPIAQRSALTRGINGRNNGR